MQRESRGQHRDDKFVDGIIEDEKQTGEWAKFVSGIAAEACSAYRQGSGVTRGAEAPISGEYRRCRSRATLRG